MISLIYIFFTFISTHATESNGVVTYTRHPMSVVICGNQVKSECYGIAGDLSAEQDGVCGWSPTEGSCAVVSIGEEPKEGAPCFMHKTIADCINSNVDPASSLGIGPGMVDAIERVCAWNPYSATCKDGQLENEPGDFTFGRGTGRGCAWGSPTAETCPLPLCRWNGRFCTSSGMGGLWNYDVVPVALKNTHSSPSSPSKRSDTFAAVGYCFGGFGLGLVLALAYVNCRRRKNPLSEPLSLDPVA